MSTEAPQINPAIAASEAGQPEVLGVNDPRNTMAGTVTILAPRAIESISGQIGAIDTNAPLEPFGPEAALMPELDQPDSRLVRVATKLGKLVSKGILQRVRTRRQHAAADIETEGQALYDWAEADSGFRRMDLETARDTIPKHAAGRQVDGDDFTEAGREIRKAWDQETSGMSTDERDTLSQIWQNDHTRRIEEHVPARKQETAERRQERALEAKAKKADAVTQVLEQYGGSTENLTGLLASSRTMLARTRGLATGSMNKFDRDKLLRSVNERYRTMLDATLATIQDPVARERFAKAEAETLAKDTVRIAREAFETAKSEYDGLIRSGRGANRAERTALNEVRGRYHAARREAIKLGLEEKLPTKQSKTTEAKSGGTAEALTLEQQLVEARRTYIMAARGPKPETTAVEEARSNYKSLWEQWQTRRLEHPIYKGLGDEAAAARLRLEEFRSEAAHRYATEGESDSGAIERYRQVVEAALLGIPEEQQAAQRHKEAQRFNNERKAYAARLSAVKPSSEPFTVRPAA